MPNIFHNGVSEISTSHLRLHLPDLVSLNFKIDSIQLFFISQCRSDNLSTFVLLLQIFFPKYPYNDNGFILSLNVSILQFNLSEHSLHLLHSSSSCSQSFQIQFPIWADFKTCVKWKSELHFKCKYLKWVAKEACREIAWKK